MTFSTFTAQKVADRICGEHEDNARGADRCPECIPLRLAAKRSNILISET